MSRYDIIRAIFIVIGALATFGLTKSSILWGGFSVAAKRVASDPKVTPAQRDQVACRSSLTACIYVGCLAVVFVVLAFGIPK